MDSHAIREENAVLRNRVTEAEEKLRLCADALEKRNSQLKEWTALYEDLRNQFLQAQDTCNSQAELIKDRDSAIIALQQIINQLRVEQMKQSTNNRNVEADLHNKLYQKELEFKEQLSKMSNAKAPAEEKFRQLGELLDKKESTIQQMQNDFKKMNEQLEVLDQQYKNQTNQINQLQNDKANLEQENRNLVRQLIDAKSGREELQKIEELQVALEKQRQLNLSTRNKAAKLKKIGQVLRDEGKEKDRIIEETQANVELLVSKVQDYSDRLQSQIQKCDDLRERCSKAIQNERTHINKYNEKESECKRLHNQIQILEEQLKFADRDHARAVHNRIREMKNESAEKEKQRANQIRIKQEIEKRLNAEENLFMYKDQVAELQKEVSILKEQLADAKGADVQPLINLIQDLRIEAIGIDPELTSIMEEIPQETPFSLQITSDEINQNDDICEEEKKKLIKISANMAQIQIENRELRLLLERCIRIASIYHRVSHVIAQYPILSMDDIGTQAERGNWLLPANVEHLQRTIIKLHEILIRRKYD